MPTLRGAATSATTGATAATTLAVTKPTGVVANDVILLYVVNGGSPAVSVAGFQALPTTLETASSEATLFYRVADGSEGATFTVTIATAKSISAQCIAYSQVNVAALFDPSWPANSGVANATSTTVTVSAITTVNDGDQLVWFAFDRVALAVTPPAITKPAAFAAQGSQASSSSATLLNVGCVVADLAQVSHGASGTVNGTVASTAVNGGILVALPGLEPPPVGVRTRRRIFPFRARARTAQPPPAPAAAAVTPIPPQAATRRRVLPPRPRARTAQPPPPPTVVVVLLPPQGATRRIVPPRPRRAFSVQAPPAGGIFVTFQPPPPRRRFLPPRKAARTFGPPLVPPVTYPLPPQQTSPRRLFTPRPRARTALPPPPVIVSVPAVAPRRRIRPPARRAFTSSPPAAVLVVAPPLVPQPQTRRLAFRVRARARTAQPPPPVVVLVAPPLPPQQPVRVRLFQPRPRARTAAPVPPPFIPPPPPPFTPQQAPRRWMYRFLPRRAATQTAYPPPPIPPPPPPPPAVAYPQFNRVALVNITAGTGISLPGPVTVTLHGQSAPAPIFEDFYLLIPKVNPFLLDGAEIARFAAADGDYDVTASYQGTSYTMTITIKAIPPRGTHFVVGEYWPVLD